MSNPEEEEEKKDDDRPATGHPLQTLEKDANGHIRFKENKIVRFLLDAGPFDLNKLSMMPFSDEDNVQFLQLIGMSLGGFSERTDCVSDADYDRAATQARSQGFEL